MIINKGCYVRVANIDDRKNLCDWLEKLGIRVCKCTLFKNWNTVHCSNVKRSKCLEVEIHGVPDYDEEVNYGIEQFKNEVDDLDFYEDVEKFKSFVENNLTNNNI